MRQVQSAEHSMPVGVVALGPSDRSARGLRVAPLTADEREPLHFLVHPVGLRVFREKIAPVAATNERSLRSLQTLLSQLGSQIREMCRGLGWQRPFFHFPVGGAGEIGEAVRG